MNQAGKRGYLDMLFTRTELTAAETFHDKETTIYGRSGDRLVDKEDSHKLLLQSFILQKENVYRF